MSGRAGRRVVASGPTVRGARLGRWGRLVDLLDERESATALAWIRILVSLVLMADWLMAARMGVVETLWGPSFEGGFGLADTWESPPPIQVLLGASLTTTWVLFGAAVISTLTFGLGLLTRISGLVLLFASTQLAWTLGQSDRGIDIAIRIVIMLLICSGCGRTLSVDARRKTGEWRPNVEIPSWPRYLIIIQLLWMYFGAGIHKTQSAWWPGDLSALYIILRDPHFARFDFDWIDSIYVVTQGSTFVTMLFEIGAPLMGLALWYRRTRERPGRIRGFFNRIRFVEVWIAIGAGFHVALMFTLQLGIFPYGMLAFYPAFFTPEQLEQAEARLVSRIRSLRTPKPKPEPSTRAAPEPIPLDDSDEAKRPIRDTFE